MRPRNILFRGREFMIIFFFSAKSALILRLRAEPALSNSNGWDLGSEYFNSITGLRQIYSFLLLFL